MRRLLVPVIACRRRPRQGEAKVSGMFEQIAALPLPALFSPLSDLALPGLRSAARSAAAAVGAASGAAVGAAVGAAGHRHRFGRHRFVRAKVPRCSCSVQGALDRFKGTWRCVLPWVCPA